MAKKPNDAPETAPAAEPAVPAETPPVADPAATAQPASAPIDVAAELRDHGEVVAMPSDGLEVDAEPIAQAVTFTLGAGERTLNGRRRFPATVVARNPDGTVDLLVDYGQPQGTGTRRNVRQGAEAGCWSE
jgi:hypothetical protein